MVVQQELHRSGPELQGGYMTVQGGYMMDQDACKSSGRF